MTSKPSRRTRILFVCMGNICRSPLAESVFRHLASERGVGRRFEVDSAGTGNWHVGEPADPRVVAVAKKHGIKLMSAARQVQDRDFEHYDWILCADTDNRETLLRRGAPEEKTRLLLEFDPATPGTEVPDPYFGGADGFEQVYGLVESACAALMDNLLAGGGAPAARPAAPPASGPAPKTSKTSSKTSKTSTAKRSSRKTTKTAKKAK